MTDPLIIKFKNLLTCLNNLSTHLIKDLPEKQFWLSTSTKEENSTIVPKEKLIQVINNLDTVVGTPQETFACLGAIGGTAVTLELVNQCNQARDQFKQQSLDFMRVKKTTDTKIIRQCLQEAGYPQTKLKHVYRHIRYIDFHPRRIAFTKVKHNSHRIISQKKAATMLASLGDGTHIAIQLARLSQLPPHENLVIHRDVKPVWAANISTFKTHEKPSIHQRILTSLPIVYLYNPDLPETCLEMTTPHANKKAKVRADKKIEEFPFLQSISAYRYKPTL